MSINRHEKMICKINLEKNKTNQSTYVLIYHVYP